MSKNIVLSMCMIVVLALTSFLNPYERINSLEHGMKEAQFQIALLQEQLGVGSPAKGVKPRGETDVQATTAVATTTPKSIAELERAFHAERYRQLGAAPAEDMLVWMASNRTKTGHRSYAYLLDDFDYLELKTGTDTLPSEKKYKFILARGDKVKMRGLCRAAEVFHKYRAQPDAEPYPHVLFFSFHEDYGGMRWEHAKQRGCSKEKVDAYVNHPDTIAAFTVQTHYTDVPKIHSIALGYRFVMHGNSIHKALHNHSADQLNRWQPVMFNNKVGHAKASRQAALNRLRQNFNHTNTPVHNTYGRGNTLQNYYKEMDESKFIASPKGLGGDCYRNYEAIFMGCIPIMEIERKDDGWRRLFDDLPVSWIQPGFREVTPEWVEKEYRRVLEGGPYNWKKMLKSWWFQHIHSLVDNHLAASSTA